jgi:hypothetical protein
MSAKSSAAAQVEVEVEVDPVLAAFERAPVGGPETDEERELVATAKASGVFVRATNVDRMIAERAHREK